MYKKLSLLFAAMFLLALPAEARLKDSTLYYTFHFGVYAPVHVISFFLAGPLIVLTSVVQHFDTKLYFEMVEKNPTEDY
jgi:hypothetical protein